MTKTRSVFLAIVCFLFVAAMYPGEGSTARRYATRTPTPTLVVRSAGTAVPDAYPMPSTPAPPVGYPEPVEASTPAPWPTPGGWPSATEWPTPEF
jgi:hypothetical protein